MEFIDAIKKAGVVGAGGAGFPTSVKLNAKAEYLLINAAECEPLIETDKYIMREFATKVVETVDKIAEHLEATHKFIALKGEYHREIAALEAAIKELGSTTEVFKMKAYYPAGDEQVLVQNITGRSVPERGLPLNVGCVVTNVGTVLGIADALEDKPVTEKYLSVTGDVAKKKMTKVPLGTPITKVLAAAGVDYTKKAVIMGGPMMGKMLRTQDQIEKAVVTKTTGNLLVLPLDHHLVRHSQLSIEAMIKQANTSCLQCRFCTDLCPREAIGHDVKPHLTMRTIFRRDQITDTEEFDRVFGHAQNCSSCGLCELFSCPMGLSPRRMNDYVKGLLREKGINHEKNQAPVAKSYVDDRRVPTARLIARLGLSGYYNHDLPEFFEFDVDEVIVPVSQHIGKPAVPCVNVGDTVNAGDLIAQAAEGLSANIHTGFAGVVKEVGPQGIRIAK